MMDIQFSVEELDAEALVTKDIYGDNGEVIGEMPEEEYQRLLEERRGQIVFECTATTQEEQAGPEGLVLVPKSIRFQSAIVEREMRGGAMAEMFAAFGSSLFTQFFK